MTHELTVWNCYALMQTILIYLMLLFDLRGFTTGNRVPCCLDVRHSYDGNGCLLLQ